MKWWQISIALTVVGSIAYLLSTTVKRNFGLGITAGWVNVLSALTDKTVSINFAGGIIIGIILGAMGSALITGEFKLRAPKKPIYYLYAVLGGALMGFGAALAKGCNVGHFLVGSSMLSLGAIFASLMFIIGNWVMVRILFGKAE